jgi:curved DNA-binding protein
MEYVDYYAELGIPRDAPQDEIGPAFKKLARKYHPDVNKEPGAEDRFKRIVEAHEVLKDPESRKKYDRFGSAWNRVGNAPEADDPLGRARGQRGPRVRADEAGARGFSEIFEAMFGRGAPRGGFGGVPGGAPESMAEAGDDLDVRVQLTLEEALEGGEREVRLSEAGGKSRTLRVTLPKGVREGQRMRLKGQGHKGVGGGPPGDLFLHLELKPHERFTLEGDDIRTLVEVAPWTATLGGEVRVQTLENAVMVKVPAGSSSGRKIRLRNKGWPTKDGRGDLYAEVRVMVPKTLTDKERAAWEKLAAVSDFMSEGTEAAE